MARIRTIKPDFFVSEDVSALPLRARLTWIGLWTHCDDHGRTKDVPKLVKAALWALDDVSLRDVEDDLAVLAEQGRIVRYTSPDGGRLLAVVGWHEHQAINRPSRSKHPAPPEPVRGAAGCPDCDPGTPPAPDRAPSRRTPGALTEPSVSAHGALPSGRERKGREQGGDAHARPHAVIHSLPVDKSTPPPPPMPPAREQHRQPAMRRLRRRPTSPRRLDDGPAHPPHARPGPRHRSPVPGARPRVRARPRMPRLPRRPAGHRLMTTTPTPGATMTTDHRAEALRLLTPGETHDAGEWTRACPTPDQALVHAVLHLADQLRPADVRGGDHAREGDGTIDPGSGRETGARRDGDLEHIRLAPDNRRYRFEVGEQPLLQGGAAGTVCEASTASHGGGPRYAVLLDGPAWYWESQLETLPPVEPDEPTPAGVTVQPDASPTDAVGWRYGVRYHDGSVTDEWNGTTQRQHAVDLARLFPDAVVVRRRLNAEWQPAPADLTEVDPTPGPVDLPTTPGSVAVTKSDGTWGFMRSNSWQGGSLHTDSWWCMTGEHDGWVFGAELVRYGVVKTFDAGTGRVRVFDAGTVA